MSAEGDFQIKFICAVRNSVTSTSDIDRMALETLKTYETDWSPAGAPEGRIRKYIKYRMGDPCAYIGVPPGRADPLGAAYAFERPCRRSAFLDTVTPRLAYASDCNGLLRTFPDARDNLSWNDFQRHGAHHPISNTCAPGRRAGKLDPSLHPSAYWHIRMGFDSPHLRRARRPMTGALPFKYRRPAPKLLGNFGRIRQNMADSRAGWANFSVPSRSVAPRGAPKWVFLAQ